MIEIAHKGTAKPHEIAARGVSYLFRADQTQASYRLLITIQPFADIVGGYTCHNRDDK